MEEERSQPANGLRAPGRLLPPTRGGAPKVGGGGAEKRVPTPPRRAREGPTLACAMRHAGPLKGEVHVRRFASAAEAAAKACLFKDGGGRFLGPL